MSIIKRYGSKKDYSKVIESLFPFSKSKIIIDNPYEDLISNFTPLEMPKKRDHFIFLYKEGLRFTFQKFKNKVGKILDKRKIVLCPDCFGDGIATCHNPDHGYFNSVLYGLYHNANQSACPCCGHDRDHKMKGKCETCKGTGRVSKEYYDAYLDEFVKEDDRDEINEYCL